jgi:sporulation protein YlmC with PRC-barrel domain
MARMDHEDLNRSRLDQAGIGPHAGAAVDLVPLRQLDGVRVVEGDADVRGWDVCTINGAKVGVVDDLLVDRARAEVVMLDVDLTGSNRHTLAPIRAAQIDRVRRIVLIDSADLNGPDVAALATPVADIARPTDTARPADVAPAPIAGEAIRAADVAHPADVRRMADGTEETVVERRPIVYEEVVVRRRVADPADPANPAPPTDTRR